jgi:DNA-binding NtrC family response regulator
VTGFGTPERSIEALDAGAFWFIEKDYERIGCLGPLIAKALEFRRLHSANRQLQRQLESRYGFENIVGHSDSLRATLDTVRKVADSDATVLVLGESGAGKELVARAIHYNSPRAARAFVAVNCGAIPEELLESELFGHVRGAFTGALRDRIGRFTAANGGTLFLDEIGDMSPQLQTKLLRALQEREFEPVGSSRTERVDVRIVAATNQNLPELIKARRFREDLYFRLAVVPIEVPALRQRREDIPLLVRHFLELHRRTYPELQGVTEAAQKRMVEYDWPGNVRQLQGLIERLAILRRSGWIDESDLPAEITGPSRERPSVELPPTGVDFEALVASFEEDLILRALDATDGNKNRAAQLLNLKRTTLVEKIRSKGIRTPER